jgi:hypothetical protein
MIEIGKTLISLDVLQKKFCCNLSACLGTCCVQGDSGAPLTQEEVGALKKVFPIVKEFMRKEGIQAVADQGLSIVDSDGDTVTPLINKGECAFVVYENGIALCSIELAFKAGRSDWMKPVSCHLYPIRIKKYKYYDAVNYDSWDICEPALKKGKELGLPAYVFVKEALIRHYGQEWFDQLDYAAKNLNLDEL